jgi:peroxiredoxin Q/BCP
LAKLEVGSKAPAFTLQDGEGNSVSIPDDVLGTRTVVYFYPKDDTPGCTKEACSFRDRQTQLRSSKLKVYGVSADGAASHERFTRKYGLNFPLLSDPGHAIAAKYGAYGEKTMYGKKVVGVIRSTFLIGVDGRIEHIWRKVDTARHAEEVLAKLRELDGKVAAPQAKSSAKAAAARGGPKKAAAAGSVSRSKSRRSENKSEKSKKKPAASSSRR